MKKLYSGVFKPLPQGIFNDLKKKFQIKNATKDMCKV